MGSMAARLAGELGLALSIGILAMTAHRTSPGRAPGINRHEGAPSQFRFVGKEAAELSERPARESIASVGATSRYPLADALQVFQGDPTTGAFDFLDDRFADDMVRVSP